LLNIERFTFCGKHFDVPQKLADDGLATYKLRNTVMVAPPVWTGYNRQEYHSYEGLGCRC